MDLFPTPEQELLIQTARDFATRSVTTETVRVLEASDAGFDPAHWRAMADLGWTELAPLELALVSEALGRAALPSPLVMTGALRNALPELATRVAPDAVITLAALVPGARDEWQVPRPTADGGMLTGTWLLVPYADAATVIVAPTSEGLVAIELGAGGVVTQRETVIGGDAMFRVECTDAPTTALVGALDFVLDHVAVAALAATVGAAEGALELSVQHARDRQQFGRPIGSFQAVAHRCADMRAEIDACRLLAWRAAWALGADDDTVDVEFAVTSALGYAKDALRRVAMHAHQVHGAIGFSSEHDLHLFTRRIKAFELTAGSTAYHQERFATAIGLSG
jgi:alkylation response protein AidB-like acyl-CoA dehydrogenase